MCDISTLSKRVLKLFSGWRGYPAFSRVLAEFPDLEVYVAGGVVRNLALDAEAKVRDIDLFLGGLCTARALDRLAEMGHMARGIYGNFLWSPHPDEPVYGDLIVIPEFHPIRPSENMLDALNQCDCTANAIAVDMRSGAVLDPHEGVEDLQRRIMRAVRFDFSNGPIISGNVLPRAIVNWFRLLHYSAALGLNIEPVTMRWLLAHRAYRDYRDAFARQFKEPHPNALVLVDPADEVRRAS